MKYHAPFSSIVAAAAKHTGTPGGQPRRFWWFCVWLTRHALFMVGGTSRDKATETGINRLSGKIRGSTKATDPRANNHDKARRRIQHLEDVARQQHEHLRSLNQRLVDRQTLGEIILQTKVGVVMIMDQLTYEILMVSDHAQPILGFNPRDMLHEDFRNFIHPDDRASTQKAFAQIKPQSILSRIVIPGGDYLPMMWNLWRLNGHVIAFGMKQIN